MSEMLHPFPAFSKEQVLLRPIPTLPWTSSRGLFQGVVGASRSERAYLADLDSLIVRSMELGAISFAELTRECLGAWPGLIADRLTALGLWNRLSSSPAAPAPSNYDPELHCGFGEWYFSATTARALADEYLAGRTFSVIFGAPTVADLAAKMDTDFVLVDNNPFVSLRFPLLKERLFFSQVEYLNLHLTEPSTVFLDPPWYLPRILVWLAKASQITSRSSTIVMPLFRELTRPAAEEECEFILDFAKTIGTVELIRNSVEYDSPLYEVEALTSQGVTAHPNWRRADLLVIKHPREVAAPEEPYLDQQSWENFLIGSQVIRLRVSPRNRRRGLLLSPLRKCEAFVLDTVSARDPRRPKIDLWSSRNRVASVGDFRRLRYILSILAMDGNLRSQSEIRSRLSSLLTAPETETLLQFLSWGTSH
jgi:hypothetical protein